MALNFNLLAQAPNLGAQFAAGQDAALQAQQARQQMAAQQQQMAAQQQQLTVSGMQMQKMQREEAALANIAQTIRASGGPADLDVAADQLITSGTQGLMDMGIKLKQALNKQREFAKIGAGAAAQQAAPAVSPPAGEMAQNEPAPTNALAPAQAAPSRVNAMAAPAQARLTELQRQRDQYLALGTSEGLEAAKARGADIAALQRQHVIGNKLVSATGDVIYAAPDKADKQEADINIMQAMGFPLTQQGYAAYQATKRQPAASTTVVMPPQEKAEKGARGNLLVEQYKGISDAAKLAGRTLPALETQERVLNSGFKTGFSTEVQKAGASVLSALGVPEATQYATNAEKFLSATQQAVLQKQLEQKGTQTKNDADRIEQTGAQLGNTPDANKFILSVAKAQLKRDIEQRNFYNAWWKKNDTYDGAEDAWFSGEGNKSLFDRPELKQYAAPAKAAPAAAPPRGRSSVQEQADAILRGGR